MDALVAGGCKIATPTGVVAGKGPAYSGAGITGLTYDVWHYFTGAHVS